jgi:hypothetical protein
MRNQHLIDGINHFIKNDVEELKKLSSYDFMDDYHEERMILKKIYLLFKLETYQTYQQPIQAYIHKKQRQGREFIYVQDVEQHYVNEQNKMNSIIKSQMCYQTDEDYKTIELVSQVHEQIERVKQSKATKQDKMEIKKFDADRLGYKTENMSLYEKHEQKLRNRHYFNKNAIPDVEKEMNKLRKNEITYKAFPIRCKIIKDIQSLDLDDMSKFDYPTAFSIFDKPFPSRTTKYKNDQLWYCHLLNTLLSEFCFEIEKKRKGDSKTGFSYSFHFKDMSFYKDLLKPTTQQPEIVIVNKQEPQIPDYIWNYVYNFSSQVGKEVYEPRTFDKDNDKMTILLKDGKHVLIKVRDNNSIEMSII